MFGGSELLILAVIVLVLFVAPSKLPGLGKSLAQSIKGFKNFIRSCKQKNSVYLEDIVEKYLKIDSPLHLLGI